MESSSTAVSLADRQRIYRILADEFEFGVPIPMATVSSALLGAGVNKEDYGYKKLKPFLADMGDFLSFTDIIAGGVPQRLVTIIKRDDWTAERMPCTDDDLPTPQRDAAEDETILSNDALAMARRIAQTPEYIAGPVPRGIKDELRPRLSDFCYFPSSTLDILRANVPHGIDVCALLNNDWACAFEAQALRYYEGKVIFPLHVRRSDGTTSIEISIRHVSYENAEEKPWYVSYVDTYVRPARPAQALVPSRELEKFAWLGPWAQFLGELAALALPETWDFGGIGACGAGDVSSNPNAILKSYICTTFYRLKLEDKICVDDGGTFAAFNTGLVTRCYDDIYACFEPNSSGTAASSAGSASSWRFTGFCTGGARGLGKRLVSLFNPLPEPASYFERKEDLLFDLEKDLIIDFDHVLIDNIGRLPLAFLEEEIRGNDRARGMLDGIRTADESARARCFKELGEIVEDDARLFRRLRRCLDDAVDVACKRVRWNFKTAIPCYYPRANSMSLLLPLSLMRDDVADVALVVQLMPSGNYQGQTILTMRQAYMNARLICRPDSDWLTATGCDLDADEEE